MGITRTTPAPDVAAAYLGTLVTATTRRAYTRHIDTALAVLDCSTLSAITPAALATYREQVRASGLAPATQRQALAAVRSFLAWAKAEGAHALLHEDVMAALPLPPNPARPPITVLTVDELAALLAAAGNARNRAIIAILAGTGLRISEVAALTVADVQRTEDGSCSVRVEGQHERHVPLMADVARYIDAHQMETRRARTVRGPLFSAFDTYKRNATPLTARAIDHMIKRVAERAGITRAAVSARTLRDGLAIRNLRSGVSVQRVQALHR